MYHYEKIISTAKESFPEIETYKTMLFEPELGDWIINEDSPYIFFPAFWKLLEYTLIGRIEDNGLTSRIFQFMENMANSEAMVRDLMAIEMLEPLFGLEYDTYDKAIKRYLLPETLKIHKMQLPFFCVPKPK